MSRIILVSKYAKNWEQAWGFDQGIRKPLQKSIRTMTANKAMGKKAAVFLKEAHARQHGGKVYVVDDHHRCHLLIILQVFHQIHYTDLVGRIKDALARINSR